MTDQHAADDRVLDHLGELPRAPFTETFRRTVELTEDYGLEWAVDIAHRLGLTAALAEAKDAASLGERLGLAEGFRPALSWVLGRLAAAGLLREDYEGEGGERRFRLEGELRPSNRQALRAELLQNDPANQPTVDLLDAAGEAYPAVGRGEKSGEEILLGPAASRLWLAYFNNANTLYAINNQIAATIAANRLPANGACRILEVGAGGGSGSDALAREIQRRELTQRVEEYRVTELSPFFRRRAQRQLTTDYPQLALAFAELDIDRPWGEQGVEARSFDCVFGVNVFHVAKNLETSLAEARRALRPGGCLIVAECLRPQPGQRFTAEMIFQLLKGFNEVELDTEIRPNAGFLTPEQWITAVARAGFPTSEVVPDLAAIREVYPHFFTGAVCARA